MEVRVEAMMEDRVEATMEDRVEATRPTEDTVRPTILTRRSRGREVTRRTASTILTSTSHPRHNSIKVEAMEVTPASMEDISHQEASMELILTELLTKPPPVNLTIQVSSCRRTSTSIP